MLRMLVVLLTLVGPVSAQDVATVVTGIDAPDGLIVGDDGTLYAAKYTFPPEIGGVFAVDGNGTISTHIANLQGPAGMDFGADGALYVAVYNANTIVRRLPGGAVQTFATGMNGPIGIEFGPDGMLYVANYGSTNIARIDASGRSELYAHVPGLREASSVTFDDAGNLYVVGYSDGRVFKVTPQREVSVFAQSPAGSGFVRYANGFLYLSNAVNHSIERVNAQGVVERFVGDGVAGFRDGPRETARLNSPNGIAISPDQRRLYIIEAGNRAIRVVALDDTFSINQGMAGAWFNPQTSGQGVLFDIEPQSRFAFAAIFTYESAVAAKLGAPEHRWLTLQGNYQGDTAQLQIFLTSGGVFDQPVPTTTVPIGTATVQFQSCQAARMDYRLDQPALSGSIDLQRVIPGSEALCEQLALPTGVRLQ